MTTQTRQIPMLHTRAAFEPATLNEDERTVEIIWTTGAEVRRFDWWTEKEWIEELSLDDGHVRLDRLNNGAPVLPNHRNYSLNDVIGVVEEAWIVDGEGRAVIRFSEREDVQEIFKEVKSGILRNISVGYKIHELEEQDQRQDDLKVFRAVDWEPMEISLVTIPADAHAQVRSESETYSVIINHRGNAMTAKVEQEQTEKRAADDPAETVKQPAAESPIDHTAVIKQERDRVKQIRLYAARFESRLEPGMVDGFISDGTPVDDAKSKILEVVSEKMDAETSRSDVSVVTDEKDKFIEQGVNALRARAGIEKMDGANNLRGLRLTEIAKCCLDRAGVSHQGMSELEMTKRAFTTSTSDFPVLLENTMHKTLDNAYAEASATWPRFCATGSVTDFRAHNRYRTGSFGNLDAVNELSEYKNKSVPDGEKESITAATKGNIINISRQTIINDDLGAFIGLANMLGRAARRTIEADVYALLASNPVMSDGIALFHANHSNLAGSGAAISIATAEAARVAMAQQQDVSGNDYLDLRPAVWLGGMSAGGTARETFGAEWNDDTSKRQSKPNIVRGLVEDIVDTPRISGNEWYLFASAMDAPVIEVAFLNGEQTPFLDSMDGFNVDGMQWKVRLDYGVAAIDWRGAYKNAGA